MDEAAMAALIVANIKTLNADIDAAQEAALISYWTQICKGIIEHIIAAAVVDVSGADPQGGTVNSTGGITS